MYKVIFGLAVAAVSVGALGQEQASAWGYYEPQGGTLQAGVVGADGSQFILKCDKPGKRKVYAVVVATTSLARPLPDDRFESFPVTVRMDQNSPYEDNWRFNDKFAMAMDQGSTRALTRLLEQLDDASAMEVRFKPLNETQTVIRFNVAGAREAIQRVYASCRDDIPTS
jgi:hypothetical protein